MMLESAWPTQAAQGGSTMGRKLFVLLALTVLASSAPAESKMRGPSTPEERARALNYIQSLEQKPLAKDSVEKRIWLTEWIVRGAGITAKICRKWASSFLHAQQNISSTQ